MIPTDPDGFTFQRDEPLNVELITLDGPSRTSSRFFRDPAGLEHHNFAALWLPKVKGQAVNEQMVTSLHFELHRRVPGAHRLTRPNSCAAPERFLAVIRREQNRPRLAGEAHLLPEIENG